MNLHILYKSAREYSSLDITLSRIRSLVPKSEQSKSGYASHDAGKISKSRVGELKLVRVSISALNININIDDLGVAMPTSVFCDFGRRAEPEVIKIKGAPFDTSATTHKEQPLRR